MKAGCLINNKIVLVVPPSRTHYIVPPIGLGYLAASLRADGFRDVFILDCLKENLSHNDLHDRFSRIKGAVYGFQVFSYDVDSVVKSIKVVKKIDKNVVVIIGGPHVSATEAQALEDIPGADFGFVGEAEAGLPLLMKRLFRDEQIPWEEIPGLIYREGKSVHVNPRAMIDDLDANGFPAWDLMVPAEYPDNPQGGFYERFPIAPISTSRGCPYSCTFCASSVNMGRKLRVRSIPNVLAEMEILYEKFGVREFHIIDDAFNFHKPRVLEFCDGIEKRNWKISYTFPNGLRLNMLDAHVLKRMKESGAYAFTVGIESGSQKILDDMKKQLSLELIREKVNLICEAGLEPSGFFILGYPTETREDILKTIAFAKELPIKRAHFSNFLPLPGTQATNQLFARGEIGHFNYEEMFYSKVAYSPPGISRHELKALQRKAFLSFYLRPKTLLKMLGEIKSYRHFKSILNRAVDYLFVK